ncbi:MAG: phenylalanine--tRNA ligase subunit alpha [Puniceicoccales bacterium]|jgi:phenylalanyl-tRNA synthetase alpha chain|nr:phenylalanine--tRNA ligase subunit alpha [Puniceicoccales bacterium]
MIAKIDEILREAMVVIGKVSSRADLEAAKAKFLSPSGSLRELIKGVALLSKEEKPAVGQAINVCKSEIDAMLAAKLVEIESAEAESLLGEAPDPTLSKAGSGGTFCHPLTQIKNRIVEILGKLGFSVADGSEIETEWFCFDALNTPQSHPSRSESDTFYFDTAVAVENVAKSDSERYILRAHTSTVQIRTMLQQKPPIKILSPGTVFRRDAIDATHSPSFHQCEGLVVEEGTNVCDLKATLAFLFEELIGKGCEMRMRPSFFPFVSPGFEVDFRSENLGKLSNRWIEICGCGMVAPSVFKNCGYGDDAAGFAFGVGIERLAMLLYGVDDIRLFFKNDARFLRQFATPML